MTGADYEVVWPLHRRHWLSALDDPGSPDPEFPSPAMAASALTSADPSRPSPSGRDLVARALLAGAGCAPQRVSELLGVSRRTLGRMADADLTAARHEAPLVDQARTWLVDSASRGSCTAEERDAAIAWLRDAERCQKALRQFAARRPAR